jgi:EPS-associated MarR family transcriptional regulator
MIDYKLIREIQDNPAHTQRSLAKKLGISLGKVNYVLTGLIHKGLIQVKKIKDHPAKIRWHYVLTPKGMKEKAKIARNYLVYRMREFDRIQQEIQELKTEVDDYPSGGSEA